MSSDTPEGSQARPGDRNGYESYETVPVVRPPGPGGRPPGGDDPFAPPVHPSGPAPSRPFHTPGERVPGPAAVPYGPARRPHPDAEGVRRHALVALAAGIVLAMSCFLSPGGGVVTVLAAKALGGVETDPAHARTLLRWAWSAVAVNAGLIVAGAAAFVVAGLGGAWAGS
ncbi:hypothetical protein GCM10010466_55590 [Planomonospora alba]|uniref:Interferon-induced transmembrane protein n=1 Tax=Planomonospora alba TaxID=161354 RepID=A0ABP6NSW9_9ACTN